jgi:hypothetical protein
MGVRRAERKTMSWGFFWRMFLMPFWRKPAILVLRCGKRTVEGQLLSQRGREGKRKKTKTQVWGRDDGNKRNMIVAGKIPMVLMYNSRHRASASGLRNPG